MTDASKAKKTLSEQNRPFLWTVTASNAAGFAVAIGLGSPQWSGLEGALAKAGQLAPTALGMVTVVVLNGLLSSDTKARLVFLRWREALPGHRAFSLHGKNDPRVDLAAIEAALNNPLPTEPAEQNRAWYRLLRQSEDDAVVAHAHKRFLALRDYTSLATVVLLTLGSMGFFIIPDQRTSITYAGLLAGQLLLARTAAKTYGVRLVTTVMARVQPVTNTAPPLSVTPHPKDPPSNDEEPKVLGIGAS